MNPSTLQLDLMKAEAQTALSRAREVGWFDVVRHLEHALTAIEQRARESA